LGDVEGLQIEEVFDLFEPETGEEPKALRPPRSKNADAFSSSSWFF
jgi:hypothetical protein